jgi:nucleotide-binding universal stress UspA family protein
MAAIKKILCPTDLSNECRPALAMACEWARRFGAELHLLHVVDGISNPYPYLGPPFNEAAAWETMIRQKANTALREWPLPEGYSALKVVRELRTGSPVLNVVQYAKDIDSDLIAMGTHGRTGFSHLFLGSVAENVVRRAPCSVLTVRPNVESTPRT